MQIFFEGASNPTHRDRLIRYGAEAVSYSWSSLVPRLPKTKPYQIAEHLPPDVEVLVHGGTPHGEWDDHAYHEFIAANINRLSLAIEIDHDDYERVQSNRKEFWVHVPDNKSVPVWRPEHGEEALEDLALRFEYVAAHEQVLSDDTTRRMLRTVAAQQHVSILALGTSKVADLTALPVAVATTSSWLSPEKYGELIVWTGNRLRRYSKKYFERGVRRHRATMAESGWDVEQIEEGDPETLCALAVASFMSMEQALATTEGVQEDTDEVEPDPQHPANGSSEPPQEVERADGERTLLPILEMLSRKEETYDDEGNHTGTKETSQPRVRQENLMQCNNCVIASKCPAYKPNSSCAYDIPVRLSDTDDLNEVMRGLLEIQAQRAMFGRFSEMLEGGYPDPAISVEMDRFFKMTEKMKDINDSRDQISIGIEAKASAGVLSRIFGSNVGDAQKQFDRDIPAGEVIDMVEGDHN